MQYIYVFYIFIYYIQYLYTLYICIICVLMDVCVFTYSSIRDTSDGGMMLPQENILSNKTPVLCVGYIL